MTPPGAASPPFGEVSTISPKPLVRRQTGRCSAGVPQGTPRARVERSTGVRIEGRLQKSVRSTFSTFSRRAARQTEEARSSSTRRLDPLTRGAASRRVKGCETGARITNSERSLASPGLVPGTNPMEGVLGGWAHRPKPTVRFASSGAAGVGGGPRGSSTTANARGGALAVALPGDRGRQRSMRTVRLSQPKGAEGLQPTSLTNTVSRVLRRTPKTKAVEAKNLDIRRRERQRELR